MAGKTSLPGEETGEGDAPRVQMQSQPEQAPEQDASSNSAQIPTLADISPDQPLVHQLAQFSQLTTSLKSTIPLTDESRTLLKGIRAEFENRIQRSSGVVPYNTAWVFLNSQGRRLEKKFLAARHQHYSARSLLAQEEEKSSGLIDESTPLPSEYFTALAEAYGPSRANRLLTEAPTDFEPAGMGYRYISLKNPRVLFLSSDPELTPIWDQATVVLKSIYEALGEDFSPAKRGPIYLKAQEGGFPYSDEDLKTFESFSQTFAITPPAKRYPVRAIEENTESMIEEQNHLATPIDEKADAALAPKTEAADALKSRSTPAQATTPVALSNELRQTDPAKRAGDPDKSPPLTALETAPVILAPGSNHPAPATELDFFWTETPQSQPGAESLMPWDLREGFDPATTPAASARTLLSPAAPAVSSDPVDSLGSTTPKKKTNRGSRMASTHTGLASKTQAAPKDRPKGISSFFKFNPE